VFCGKSYRKIDDDDDDGDDYNVKDVKSMRLLLILIFAVAEIFFIAFDSKLYGIRANQKKKTTTKTTTKNSLIADYIRAKNLCKAREVRMKQQAEIGLSLQARGNATYWKQPFAAHNHYI